MAHRVAWEARNGPIPEGMKICHRCDVRHCIEPDHLFIGTQRENIHDAMRKKRHNFGARVGTSKFTEEQAREIKYGGEGRFLFV